MEINRLSALHRRVQVWQESLTLDIDDQALLTSLESHLKQYQSLLLNAWQTSNDLDTELSSLERVLEDLNERVRLTAKRVAR